LNTYQGPAVSRLGRQLGPTRSRWMGCRRKSLPCTVGLGRSRLRLPRRREGTGGAVGGTYWSAVGAIVSIDAAEAQVRILPIRAAWGEGPSAVGRSDARSQMRCWIWMRVKRSLRIRLSRVAPETPSRAGCRCRLAYGGRGARWRGKPASWPRADPCAGRAGRAGGYRRHGRST
jgi:hypothetical protein